jgi:hypothetical protein
MSGTVNIARTIWHDAAFKSEPFTEREAFMWMVMEASYMPREKRVGTIAVNLERGQLATSVRFMCDAWGWSKSRVDRYLKRLENRDMIGTASGTGINVITICKYDEYQNAPSASGTAKKEKRDSSGTAAGQQRDKPNKGLIQDAISRDTIVSLARKPKPERFEDFWNQYPHRNGAKKGKAKARQKYERLVASGVSEHEIITGAMRYATDRQVVEGYAKDPTTWLNNEGWTDDIEPAQPSRANSNGSGTGQRSSMVDAFAAVAERRSRDAGGGGGTLI